MRKPNKPHSNQMQRFLLSPDHYQECIENLNLHEKRTRTRFSKKGSTPRR